MSQWKSGQPIKQGKYIIEQLLGCGGFGVTYRAKESSSGKLVAIKTLNIYQQFKPDFSQIQEKFLNEALCLARCHHPHIVEVYPQLFQEDGVWCMVMDYVEGQDLASYRQSRGQLLEAEALEIIKQVGEALIYVHQQGFLHRDIKPKNILLQRDSLSVVLIDFGLAREFIPGEEQSLTNWGTECFAPIEQYERRGNFGAYTDVYALAATLYFVLTGELPYSATIRQRGNIPLVPPKHHNHKISDRVNNAILKVEFCARLSQKTGRMYRLPSEAEWEYACRAGTTTPFYCGETITPELANFNGSFTYAAAPKSIYHRQSTDVGSFPPNAFGLYDMHGNVWEWCADLWHSNYKGAPLDGRPWNGAENNQFSFMSRFRVLRGGSWVSRPKQCRCASRLNGNLDDWSLFNFGLRVVC
ncbi:MAG: bifunctional serine/threonine-protein kinase/formylglycine-generating enzyme family protein [Coleofasciculus chthonoplastes F3-SA18-01]|uniref:protein kinase domain-containing protein n=1 Tax=Coleofasciculus chthonoplastes TaxID=64178 RepID=UPI003301E387